MTDLLQAASDWLQDKQRRHASKTVVYKSGADSVEVNAVVGRTEFETADESGFVTKYIARDFLIPVAELVLGGTAVTPGRGDRVRETQGTQVFVHEVMAPGENPEWRYADPYRRTFRIHTKQVATESL